MLTILVILALGKMFFDQRKEDKALKNPPE